MIVIKTNDGPRGFRFQGNDLRIDSSTVVVVVALISYGYLKVESGFERVKSRRRGKVATHTCLIAGVLDLKSSVSDLINIGSDLSYSRSPASRRWETRMERDARARARSRTIVI